MMNKLHVLALYGANDVCLGVSKNNNHAGAKQRICLPRTEENVAFVERVKCAFNTHDQLVAENDRLNVRCAGYEDARRTEDAVREQLVVALNYARERLALADEQRFDSKTLPMIDHAIAAAKRCRQQPRRRN